MDLENKDIVQEVNEIPQETVETVEVETTSAPATEEARVTLPPIFDYSAVETEETPVAPPRKRHMGAKAKRNLSNAIIYIILGIMTVVWLFLVRKCLVLTLLFQTFLM